MEVDVIEWEKNCVGVFSSGVYAMRRQYSGDVQIK
jgi:hypothetical protein